MLIDHQIAAIGAQKSKSDRGCFVNQLQPRRSLHDIYRIETRLTAERCYANILNHGLLVRAAEIEMPA